MREKLNIGEKYGKLTIVDIIPIPFYYSKDDINNLLINILNP